MYQAHGFDEYISEYLVSLNRSLPDRRDDYCKKSVPLVDLLPKTSIIIIFHNEAWSTLIRCRLRRLVPCRRLKGLSHGI
jgi:polypeptide N-acetylgalactosaminyltransferase